MSEHKRDIGEMHGFEFGKRDPSFFLEFDQEGRLVLPTQEKEISSLLEAWCEGDLDRQDHSLVTTWILESPERTKFVRDAFEWTGGKTVSLAVLPEQWSQYMVDGSATNGQPVPQCELELPEVGHGVKAKIFARKDGEWEISVGKVTAVTVNGEVTNPKMTCLLPDTFKIKDISIGQPGSQFELDLPEVGHGAKAKFFARKDGEWQISVDKVTAVTVNGEVTNPKMTCLLPDTLKIEGFTMDSARPSTRLFYAHEAALRLREVSKTHDVTKSILALITEMHSDYVKSGLGEIAEGRLDGQSILVLRLAEMRYTLWDALQNIALSPNPPEDIDTDFSLFEKLDEVLQSHGIQKAIDLVYEGTNGSLFDALNFNEAGDLAELAAEFPEMTWFVPTKLKK